MALDGAFLYCMRGEELTRLIGARVDKVYMPAKESILLHLRAPGGNCKLLLCASAGNARVHIRSEERR